MYILYTSYIYIYICIHDMYAYIHIYIYTYTHTHMGYKPLSNFCRYHPTIQLGCHHRTAPRSDLPAFFQHLARTPRNPGILRGKPMKTKPTVGIRDARISRVVRQPSDRTWVATMQKCDPGTGSQLQPTRWCPPSCKLGYIIPITSSIYQP